MPTVALSLKNRTIPAHLNVKNPNPLLELTKYNLKIPQKSENWPCYGGYRLAGVSGFGFGGTNAHVLVREVGQDAHVIVRERKVERYQLRAHSHAAKPNTS